ncbi:hypothetical protein Ancab_017060 [Ancistrocladus abbreviatus]
MKYDFTSPIEVAGMAAWLWWLVATEVEIVTGGSNTGGSINEKQPSIVSAGRDVVLGVGGQGLDVSVGY